MSRMSGLWRGLYVHFSECRSRPSVYRQSVTFILRRLKFSAIFLRHLVPWSSIDIQIKLYRDRPREPPRPRELERGRGEGVNARGVGKAILDLSNATSRKRCNKRYVSINH